MNALDLVQLHFPGASKEDASDILLGCTPFSFFPEWIKNNRSAWSHFVEQRRSSSEFLHRCLSRLARRSGRNIDRVFELVEHDMDNAISRARKRGDWPDKYGNIRNDTQ